MWRIEEISFEFVDDLTFDLIVTVAAVTPRGTLWFMAAPEMNGPILLLRQLHAQEGQANQVGPANLMVLAQALMERMGFDGLEIEGAVRTSGAYPGHRPRIVRFTRRHRDPPG